MDPGIAGLVGRKYDIAQQQADAANRISWAQSGLLGAQTTAYPMEAAARAYAARGAGAAGFGQGNLSNANALAVPGLAASEEGLRGAQSTDLLGRLGLGQQLQAWQLAPNPDVNAAVNQRTFGDPGIIQGASPTVAPGGAGWDLGVPGGAGGGSTQKSVLDTAGGSGGGYGSSGQITTGFAPAASRVPNPYAGSDQGREPSWMNLNKITTLNPTAEDPNVIGGAQKKPGFDTGTSSVPGNGPSTVDSVDAKLAPGEAVLNAAAAEHLGRSTIDFLNAIGAQKMGLDVSPKGKDAGKPQGGGQKTGEAADKSSPTKAKAGDNPKISQQTGDPPGYAGGTSWAGDMNDAQWGARNMNQGSSPPNPSLASRATTPPVAPSYNSPGLEQNSTRSYPTNQEQGRTPPGYKKGTSDVGKKVSKNALPSPEIMQALMAMGQGGGGMPQMGPGGTQPMPQQLPQVA